MSAGSDEGISTRAHIVADAIRERIISGDIAPDTYLQEQALADSTGTSRTPVREALRLLVREQLVIHLPNRGYVVRKFSLGDIVNAFDVRATLEGMACRIVALKGLSTQTGALLEDCEADMHDIVLKDNWGSRDSLRWFDLNANFHRLIIDEAGNSFLSRAVEQTQRLPLIFDGNRRLHSASQVSKLFSSQDTKRAFDDHKSIFMALRLRDAPKAERLMRAHIERSRDQISRAFSSVYPHEAA